MNTLPLSGELKSRIEGWKTIDATLTGYIDNQKVIKNSCLCLNSLCDYCEEEIKGHIQRLREQSKVIVDLIKPEYFDVGSYAIYNMKEGCLPEDSERTSMAQRHQLEDLLVFISEGKTEESKGNRRITAVDKFIKMMEGSEK